MSKPKIRNYENIDRHGRLGVQPRSRRKNLSDAGLPEDTEINIVCVYQSVAPLDAFPQSEAYSEKLEEKERSDSKSFAQSAADLINEYFPESSLKIETEIKTGAPAQAILETARTWKPNIIVVGSHGRGFWGRMTVGSVSDSIIHHATCPVFVVRKTID